MEVEQQKLLLWSPFVVLIGLKQEPVRFFFFKVSVWTEAAAL